MNFDWQNLLALAVVTVAGIYLARRLWRAIRGRGGCACTGCPAGGKQNHAEGKQLVQLNGLSRKAE